LVSVLIAGPDEMKAIWNDKIIAESDDTVVIEGNHYFPLACVRREYLRESSSTTACSWPDAAWYYDSPMPAAMAIKGRVAFWRGVQIVDS
jgi:uncharacterized protein (DUF427 family)